MELRYWLEQALKGHEEWMAGFGPYTQHESLRVSDEQFAGAFDDYQKLLRGNYPFFHPTYIGQMLKPPHPVAVVGYLAAMLINPNNHSSDGGPVTDQMEKDVVAYIAGMFDLRQHLGHLTSSGTIANLEALYVARQLHPDKGVAFSAESHYTHERMCNLLGIRGYRVPTDRRGRMDVDALQDLLRTHDIGTVVCTLGTTGFGAIDPVHDVVSLRDRYGIRVHADAAYGGFFSLLAGAPGPEGLPPEPWRAIRDCDSVALDPHKHGLQPYGCGSVLFSDPTVGRLFVHDSPYTYFTSSDLHLGEISLECSRAGASAAALWLTFRLLPPTPDGLGRVMAANRRAALGLADVIERSSQLELYQRPELDIVNYFPRVSPPTMTALDQLSERMLNVGMRDQSVYLSLVRVEKDDFTRRHPDVSADAKSARVLRSVLMKPETENYLDELTDALERLAAVSAAGTVAEAP